MDERRVLLRPVQPRGLRGWRLLRRWWPALAVLAAAAVGELHHVAYQLLATILLGQELPAGTATSSSAKVILAQQVECLESGTVEAVTFNTSGTETASGTVWMGVYANNAGTEAPGKLEGQASRVGVIPAAGTYGVTGLSIPVTKGVKYWIAATTTTVSLQYRRTSAGAETVRRTIKTVYSKLEETTEWEAPKAQAPLGAWAEGKTGGAVIPVLAASASSQAAALVQATAFLPTEAAVAASAGSAVMAAVFSAAAAAVSSASASVTAAAVLVAQPAAGVSSSSMAMYAPGPAIIRGALATGESGSSTVDVRAATFMPVGAAAGASTATAGVSAPASVPVQPAAGVSSATAALHAPALLVVSPAAGASDAPPVAVHTLLVVVPQPAEAVSSATAGIKVFSFVAPQPAVGVSGASAAVVLPVVPSWGYATTIPAAWSYADLQPVACGYAEAVA